MHKANKPEKCQQRILLTENIEMKAVNVSPQSMTLWLQHNDTSQPTKMLSFNTSNQKQKPELDNS